MSKTFKPMLAGKTDGKSIRFPKLVSPKLDGVRVVIIGATVLSRKLIKIPNKFVQAKFGKPEYNGLDGELIVGNPTDPNVYTNTMSGVMSIEGTPDVSFNVFDDFSDRPGPESPFSKRLESVIKRTKKFGKKSDVYPVLHVSVNNYEELSDLEQVYVENGYEGIMIRDPDAPYKFGRSTEKQEWLLKLKRFEDSEAVVLDVIEQMQNANKAELDNLGQAKRSSKKSGMVAKGVAGALSVRDLKTGVEFEIGSGFTDIQRAQLWANYTGKSVSYKERVFDESDQRWKTVKVEAKPSGTAVIGSIVKYRFQPAGVKEKPRFPVYLGLRDKRDM